MLKRVLQDASSEPPVPCVSTQLIEASVDIDLAGLARDLEQIPYC